MARTLSKDADTLAIMGRAGASWIVADLAATFAGRRVVPVPSFFSPEQIRHVLDDARVSAVLCCDSNGEVLLGMDASRPFPLVDAHDAHDARVGHG